ncbi:hypothetical protein [Pseudomonas sp. 3JA]|uniref:hypothetical protein n=1 Tax=Pseudomonas sp. 3JA TaxID=3109347 RepID=UPI003009A28C
MAITKCKECHKEVSNKAEVCPHCGVKSPGLKMKDVIVGLVVVGLIAFVAVKCTGSNNSDQAQASTDCNADLQCWGDKNVMQATAQCKPRVERLASYTARWTDGTLEGKFPKFRWLNKDKGSLTYIGDKVEFQNGFGAYQAHVYECDFLPGQNLVLDARAHPGHL